MGIQAVIVAGGQGSRMRKVSEAPKILLPLAGKPILEHQIDWLKAAGFSDILLCLGHGADAVRAHCGDGAKFGVNLQYQVEGTPRGTAGAVKDLGDRITGDLLVVYGDLFIDMDAGKLLDFHEKGGAAATLVVRLTDHPEDSDLVEMQEDGRITKIGRGFSGDVGCAAVWVIKPSLLEYAPLAQASDFARDVFPAALAAGEKLLGYLTTETVADVGTPARYAAYTAKLGAS
jgi:NDP-sugar pyrophosphorylase family protein